MTEKKMTFLEAIKAAKDLKQKVSPETATQIHQAKNMPKSQVSSNRPSKKTTGRGK